MFGFISDIVSATVKTVILPVVIVKDIVIAPIDEEPFEDTSNGIESIKEDLDSAFNSND